jgi:hypothetical protein
MKDIGLKLYVKMQNLKEALVQDQTAGLAVEIGKGKTNGSGRNHASRV